MSFFLGWLGAIAILLLLNSEARSQSNFDSSLFEKKDRVVFVGDGFVEREQVYGEIESLLGAAYADLNLTFRNVGWSGDTPKGLSRDHYTNPPTGYDHLLEQISVVDPDILMIGYGGHLAFGEEESIEEFIEDLTSLVSDLPEMEIVLLSPVSHEASMSRSDRTTEYNARLFEVSKALAELAKSKSYRFVDLTTTSAMDFSKTKVSHTLNGIHLNRKGYARVADLICLELQCPRQAESLSLDLDGTSIKEELKKKGAMVDLNMSDGGRIAPSIQVEIKGLPKGEYELVENGDVVVRASHKRWEKGMEVQLNAASNTKSRLIELVQKKNKKYFNKYRPQNETYLVGFRRYEQGNNADEIALADPIISDMENEIARLYKRENPSLELRRID